LFKKNLKALISKPPQLLNNHHFLLPLIRTVLSIFLFLASSKNSSLVGFIVKTHTEAAALVPIFADP
jgi:hypothetical protein